jgi:phosphoribosylformylglycinamidine synthase subunit PurQ / glutaminase
LLGNQYLCADKKVLILMKTGVVTFPGSNCDHDMIYLLREILGSETVNLWHKNRDLEQCDLIVLPGGFSYGDYLRSGAIARFSPIMQEVVKFAKAGGLVLGICNGFQILTEAHLLPGALLHNESQKFECRNVWLRVETNNALLTSQAEMGRVLKIPIAHGEGNYFCDQATHKTLVDNDQILFRYCNSDGNVDNTANPNGSLDNIAGICNKERNVFGMMPHPERAADTNLGNTDGLILIESLLSQVLS